MSMFQTFIGNSIHPMGFPVVVVAIDKPMEQARTAEFFVLFLGGDGPVTVNRRRFVYQNVPETLLSDDELLKGTLHTVQTELDLALDTRRRQLSGTNQLMLPYSLRFAVQELHLADFRFLLIHHGLRDQIEQIRRETYCDELRKALPQYPRLAPWKVVEDRNP